MSSKFTLFHWNSTTQRISWPPVTPNFLEPKARRGVRVRWGSILEASTRAQEPTVTTQRCPYLGKKNVAAVPDLNRSPKRRVGKGPKRFQLVTCTVQSGAGIGSTRLRVSDTRSIDQPTNSDKAIYGNNKPFSKPRAEYSLARNIGWSYCVKPLSAKS